jgi:hypothetical protein
MKRTSYDSGLSFTQKLADNLQQIKDRIKLNKSALLVIDGGLGEGKTTIALHIANYYLSLHDKPHVDLSDKNTPHYAMGGKQFVRKLRQCYEQDLKVCIYDEAGDFNKRGSLTQFNAYLNRVFDTFRAFQVLVIICCPIMNVLDQELFDKKVPRILLHCYGRTMRSGHYKGYSLFSMMLIRHMMKKCPVKEQAYNFIPSSFKGHFLDLNPKDAKMLDKICMDAKIEISEQAEINLEGLIDLGNLSRKLAKSYYVMGTAVRTLGLEPERIYKKKMYFKEEIALPALMEFFNSGRRTRKDKR